MNFCRYELAIESKERQRDVSNCETSLIFLLKVFVIQMNFKMGMPSSNLCLIVKNWILDHSLIYLLPKMKSTSCRKANLLAITAN